MFVNGFIRDLVPLSRTPQEGIKQKMNEIALPSDWPWIETLVVSTPKPVQVEDVHDDLAREAALYVMVRAKQYGNATLIMRHAFDRAQLYLIAVCL